MSENSSALFHTVRLRDALRKDVDKLLKGIRLHKAACLVDGGVEVDDDVQGITEVCHLVLSNANVRRTKCTLCLPHGMAASLCRAAMNELSEYPPIE